MPITPTVFKTIKSSDVHYAQPFKAYKNYKLTSIGSASGYVTQSAVYADFRIDYDGEISYLTNPDGSNQHIIWKSLDHRFYKAGKYNYKTQAVEHKTYASEHFLNVNTERTLFHSASTLSIPYNDVGERIKPGSAIVSSSMGVVEITLKDDGEGNLRDSAIATSSFASSSRELLYLTFNNEFRQFDAPYGTNFNGEIPYRLQKSHRSATTENIDINYGVVCTGSFENASGGSSGLSGIFSGSDSYVRIPHEDVFNRFGKHDDWTISFYISKKNNDVRSKPIITKGGVIEETYYDNNSDQLKIRTKEITMPNIAADYSNVRTPFIIGVSSSATNNETYHFQASDGTNALHISSSTISTTTDPSLGTSWKNIIVRNSSSLCQIFVDGISSGTSGSIPNGSTANGADVMLGSFTTSSMTGANAGLYDDRLADLRMYDYAVEDDAITSLANRHYLSGSLYQTNVAGNIFYRSGQLVVSSPMPKYNTGSGLFAESYTTSWKGTHTIYDNEVLVRVPKGNFNTTVNPSTTYTAPFDTSLTKAQQVGRAPGNRYKSIFESGSAYPYITSVGLYNDKYQLLAVAKLAQPIQKRNDIDMNFLIRWDY